MVQWLYSVLPQWEAQFQSLVGKPRSCMLCDVAKNWKKEQNNDAHKTFVSCVCVGNIWDIQHFQVPSCLSHFLQFLQIKVQAKGTPLLWGSCFKLQCRNLSVMEETRLLWPAADLRGSLGFPPSLDPHRFTALLVIQQTLFGCLLHAWHSDG